MEDEHTSDKRKAVREDDSLVDLDSSSAEKPLKRPRMEDSTVYVETDETGLLDHGVIEDVEVGSKSQPIHDGAENEGVVSLPQDDGLEKSEIHTKTIDEIQTTDGVTPENDKVQEEELINENGSVNENEEPNKVILDEMQEGNQSNGDLENGLKSSPGFSSTCLSDLEKQLIPSSTITLSIRAMDSKTGKILLEEPCLPSDWLRLEAFLAQHNRSLTHPSYSSGYLGDVDSEIFPPPPQTPGFRKNRYTSSTLGSSIPRESMKTILSNSPDDSSPRLSPENDTTKTKKQGKHEPKFTSTKLPDGLKSSPSKNRKSSGKPAKKSGSGDALTNGVGKVSTKKKSDSSSSKSLKTTPGTSGTPKNRTMSREFSGLLSESTTRLNKSRLDTKAGPSPARAVAIVEGTSARPLTRFEQNVNNEPVELHDLKHSKTLWGTIAQGEPVFARWSDKNYYSGIVKEKGLNDTWVIDFDDATTYPASDGHIIPIKILGVGLRGVYCPDSGYHPADATVVGQRFLKDPEIGETVKYAIKLTNGENSGTTLWCTRRMLSIKENDARTLRNEFQPTPKVLKAADVSLENIITEGRRRGANTPKSSLSLSTPGSSRGRTVGGAFDESTNAPEDDSRRTPKLITKPKAKKRKLNESSTNNKSANSTPSAKNKPTRDTPSSSPSLSLDRSSKESPKKPKIAANHKESQQKESQLFQGFQFFLTASGGGDPVCLASGGPVVPYDKDDYKHLIEEKGGKIVDHVGKENGADKCMLISDNYARTVKYIYCLAAAIPCVSHRWVQECINKMKAVPWKTFELNAGWSFDENKVISPHRLKPLRDFNIFITAGSDDLYNYWKPVLLAAQANLLRKPRGRSGKVSAVELPEAAEVVVTDATCTNELLNLAHSKMIPVVKPEWLVQTIIAGKKADFTKNEKYRVVLYEEEEELGVEVEEYEEEDEADEDEEDEEEAQ